MTKAGVLQKSHCLFYEAGKDNNNTGRLKRKSYSFSTRLT